MALYTFQINFSDSCFLNQLASQYDLVEILPKIRLKSTCPTEHTTQSASPTGAQLGPIWAPRRGPSGRPRWDLYGFVRPDQMGPRWAIYWHYLGCTWGPDGLYMGVIWGPDGLFVGIMWAVRWVLMGYMWAFSGLYVGPRWAICGYYLGCMLGLDGPYVGII